MQTLRKASIRGIQASKPTYKHHAKPRYVELGLKKHVLTPCQTAMRGTRSQKSHASSTQSLYTWNPGLKPHVLAPCKAPIRGARSQKSRTISMQSLNAWS